MTDFERQTKQSDVPFRGTGKATDFHDVQDFQADPTMNGHVADFSKENPLTAVVSVFGIGLIVGAGVAVAMVASKQKQVSDYYSLDDLSNLLGNSISKVNGKVRNAFHS